MNDKESVYFGYKTCEIDFNGNRTGNLVIEYEGYPSLSRSNFSGRGYVNSNYVGKKCIELRDKKTIGPVFNNLSGPESEIIVNVPSDHIPMINSNEMQMVKDNGDGTCCWQARADGFALISGNYSSEKISYSKANVFFKYSEKYKNVVKTNDLDGAINSVLDYCDERIGKLDIDFSGEELSNINIVQTSAENSGGQCNGEEVYMDESFLSPSNLSESKAGANKNEVFILTDEYIKRDERNREYSVISSNNFFGVKLFKRHGLFIDKFLEKANSPFFLSCNNWAIWSFINQRLLVISKYLMSLFLSLKYCIISL